MVRGRMLTLLFGSAMLVWGAAPTEAVATRGLVEHGPAPRLERPSQTTTAEVDELLELSRLRAQLAALAGGIHAQLREPHGEGGARDRAGPAPRLQPRDTLPNQPTLARSRRLAPINIAPLHHILLAQAELAGAELAAHLGSLESPAGQWYTGALNEALVDAASVAAGL